MLVLTEEILMFFTRENILALIVVAGLIAIGATVKTDMAAAQMAKAASQTANSSASAPAPLPGNVVAGTAEAMKLLTLMDADKSGKVSRAEFMAFMAAEFDRMDINHDGELDLKELQQSQLMVVHRGGSRR